MEHLIFSCAFFFLATSCSHRWWNWKGARSGSLWLPGEESPGGDNEERRYPHLTQQHQQGGFWPPALLPCLAPSVLCALFGFGTFSPCPHSTLLLNVFISITPLQLPAFPRLDTYLWELQFPDVEEFWAKYKGRYGSNISFFKTLFV